MPSPLRAASPLPPPSTRRAHRSPFKKRLALLRFHLSKSSPANLVLLAVVIAASLILILRFTSSFVFNPQFAAATLSTTSSINNTAVHGVDVDAKPDPYVDPCLQTQPIRLLHFDPATRYSRDVPATLPPDSDPSARNRVFTTFFKAYLFEPSSDVVVSLNSTSRVHRMDVNSGVAIAETALRRYFNDSTLAISSYSLGYTHLDRIHGSRHVFHLHTRNATAPALRHVVAIQRTFDASCHVSVRAYNPALQTAVPVYLVVPYATRPRRLAWFIEQFERLIATSDNIRLILAVCKHNTADVAHAREVATASEATDRIIVLPVPGDRTQFFSRAISIREAAREVPHDAIMFVTDIDMYIFPSMFDACRFNAIQGSQVYFPVFYSLYARYTRIGRNAGYWRDSSLGMSCMYRTDFDAVAAYEDAERKFVGWGSEDRVLSMAFIKDPRYEIFRAVEPALRHKWHLKRCEAFTPAYEDCLAVMFQQLGQMSSVGRFLLKNKFDVQQYYMNYADEDDDGAHDDGADASSDKEEEELKKRRETFLRKNHELIKMKKEMMARRQRERRERAEVAKENEERGNADDSKVDEPKADGPKEEAPKPNEPKPDEPKPDEPKPDGDAGNVVGPAGPNEGIKGADEHDPPK